VSIQRGREQPGTDRDKRRGNPAPKAGRKAEAARNAARSIALEAAPLPLEEAERMYFQRSGGLSVDLDGKECLRGLSRSESMEYIRLHRLGLDNDDASFLRYILLGDRHTVATAKFSG
jgi:hypothetical protein